jgi:anaerobic magnesium-protoporphyrin IX monomethyl ester cyclase
MILINSSSRDALKIFQSFLPISIPVSIGYLLAVTEQEDIKVKFIDEQVEYNTFELIEEYVKEMERPYIFGFSVMTVAFKRAIFVSRKLKELYPDSIICFGGIHPTAIPEEVLSYEHINLVVKGEGEYVLPELYRCIKNGKDFTHIGSISYKKEGKIVDNARLPIINDLDALPPFPYHLFNPKHYDMGIVYSSRGCPYDCIFCSNTLASGRIYRFRETEAIIDDIDKLYTNYGVKFININDDNFLVNKKRIYQLLEGIRNKGFDKKITFDFQARGDNVDYNILKELYNTGFKSVFFGVETASDNLMKIINKGETVDKNVKAIQMAKEIGFHVSATFMFALPGENRADRKACLELSKKLNLDMVRYNNATPYPGTELYRIAKKEGRLNIQGLYENFISVSTFIENPFKKIPFTYVPEGNTEDEIRQDILLSYLLFYFDFKRIKRMFTDPNDGVGWFNAGESLNHVLKKIPALLLLCFFLSMKYSDLFLKLLFKKILFKDKNNDNLKLT